MLEKKTSPGGEKVRFRKASKLQRRVEVGEIVNGNGTGCCC
jgi:hypothetical protein